MKTNKKEKEIIGWIIDSRVVSLSCHCGSQDRNSLSHKWQPTCDTIESDVKWDFMKFIGIKSINYPNAFG